MSDTNGTRNPISIAAFVATMLTVSGLVWSITWAVSSSRLADQDKRITRTEQAVDQYREFRGEMKSDMDYVKLRLDEVVGLVRGHMGEQ